MESEAFRRLVNALVDVGYSVRPLTEDSIEMTFGRDSKAEVIVKEKETDYSWLDAND